MKRLSQAAVAACMGLLGIAVHAQEMGSYIPQQAVVAKNTLAQKFRIVAPVANAIVLAAPSAAEIQRLRANNAVNGLQSRALQIGFGRDVQARFGDAAQTTSLTWSPTAGGGQAAHVSLTSPGASTLRIGFDIRSAPAGMELRFAGSAEPSEVIGPFSPKPTRDGRLFWGPSTEGEITTVEIYLPPGAQSSDLAFAVQKLSHQLGNLRKESTQEVRQRAGADTCEVDIVCRYSDTALKTASAAVAQMDFMTVDDDAYVCTGTLLNSKVGDVPYFFTAGHCITDQYEALTLETYWQYESASCNASGLSSQAKGLYNGAQLLYADRATDTALLRLYDTPPAGAVYAGWNAGVPTLGAAATAIHHPVGDLKKYSAGVVSGFAPWTGGGFNSGTTSYTKATYLTGITEGGSSGGGLFIKNASTGQYQLRGGLRGGNTSCSNSNGYDLYSRLDLAYPKLAKYLNAINVDVRTYVPASSEANGYVSFLRVINKESTSTSVSVALLDPQSGEETASGTLTWLMLGNSATTFTAAQVEAAMRVVIPAGSRPRIRVSADTRIEAQSFLLQPGGVFNEMSAAQAGSALFDVRTYVPHAAAPSGYVSYVRVINTGPATTGIWAARVDPQTGVQSKYVLLIPSLAREAAVTMTAEQIEAKLGTAFAADDRPRLRVFSDLSLIDVQSFLIQPGGAFTNVSSGLIGQSVDVNSYVPAAAVGHTSFIRIINTGSKASTITVADIDDTTGTVSPASLLVSSLPAGGAVTLTSTAIEAALGRSPAASARPRLRINGTQTLSVQFFLLQPGGAYNEMSNAMSGTQVDVRTYLPAAAAASGYTSFIRVINTGSFTTSIQLALTDASGATGLPKTLVASLPKGAARTFSSSEIEALLGTPLSASARPRLRLTAVSPITVQSFLTQPGGAYTEVSGGQAADD